MEESEMDAAAELRSRGLSNRTVAYSDYSQLLQELSGGHRAERVLRLQFLDLLGQVQDVLCVFVVSVNIHSHTHWKT